MFAWPEIYIPQLPRTLILPPLKLRDSYSQELCQIPVDETFTMYICGITPYDATHIGHAATYLTFDLIHRYMKAQGTTVRFLENVTDIDDPLFERAERDQVSWRELADGQIRLFTADMTNLRVLPPMSLTTVTESMPEIIEFVSALQRQGLTYTIEGDTYLDARQVTDFEDLPFTYQESLQLFRERGGDPGREGKRHPLDPLLWRSSGEGEPSWPSPVGYGRPGWHVECNAISHTLIESEPKGSLSFQGGGADLKFPHHYMTALQNKARYGSRFAKLFVHTGMIRYQGEKMSKSLGNLVFVSELVSQGVHPMTIRVALLSSPYFEDRDWNDEIVARASQLVTGLLRVLSRELVLPYEDVMSKIVLALSDNLNSTLVFQILEEYVSAVNRTDDDSEALTQRPGALSRFLDSMLGIAL